MVLSLRTWPRRLVARPWLAGFIPINAATSGFGVVLPLLILIVLHETWTDVALAATLFNAAVILSSVVWGHLSDRYPARRLFLAINFGGYAALYLLLAFVHTLGALFAIYTVVGLIAPAGASASNLLILEKFTENERANAYASFQEMSIIGSVLGVLIGYFWTLANDALLSLLYLLAGLAAASALALWFGVKDPPRNLTTAQVARHPESLLSRIRVSASFHIAIPFFPRRPNLRAGALARFRRWAREELHHELPLIFAATFLFNLASNLYNISYTPYLVSVGLAASAIFLVNFANSFAQMLLFPLSGGMVSRFGSDRLVQWATYVRAVGYLATAGFTFYIAARSGAFAENVLTFGLLGAAIAAYTTASSLMLFRGLEHRDAGSLLGVSSALGGAAAVAGAGLSAVLASFGSFRLVFLVSAGALLASLPIWTAASVAYARRKYARAGPPTAPAPDVAAPEPRRAPESVAAAKTH